MPYVNIRITREGASAAVIDHFGLFGSMRFPIDAKRIAGIALMVAGVWLARRTA